MSEFIFLLGALFIFIGSLGILVMPDTLTRCHALSKAVTLGITLILIALFFALPESKQAGKTLLAILFQWMTIPLSGHLIALYLYRRLNHKGSEL